MKKTTTIQLILITAALAACNKPLYQQDPVYYSASDLPDSSNSCPIVDTYPPDYYPLDYFNWLYAFRYYPHYRAAHSNIIRSGFGHRLSSVGS